MIRTSLSVLLLMVAVLFYSCKQSEEQRYKSYEAEQMASQQRSDSLFYDLYFGMSKKEFRDYCFNMNIEGYFKQGGRRNSNWVEAELKGLDYPAAITFYPEFKNDTIVEMNASIYYKNAQYKDGKFHRDSLLLDVQQFLLKHYGGELFTIKSPVFYKDDVSVMVKNNRRITLYGATTDQMINLWFVDLTASIKK